MDWGKVKKTIIFFLCLLNVSLFGLIYMNNRAYRLTQSRERLIASVLLKNNIICYSEIIKNFSPMRQIEMQPPEYDEDVLLSIFMSAPESAVRSMERSRVIFRNEFEESLIIDGPGVIYKNRGAAGASVTPEEAERLGAELIKKMKKLGGNFIADGPPTETEDGWLFQYWDNYKGYLINSNSINILINGNGIASVEFTYYKPVSFIGVRREVCSPDEALLTVMHGIRGLYGDYAEPKFILKMDFVYHNNLSTKATPYYRVYVSGLDSPFLINAYENTIL